MQGHVHAFGLDEERSIRERCCSELEVTEPASERSRHAFYKKSECRASDSGKMRVAVMEEFQSASVQNSEPSKFLRRGLKLFARGYRIVGGCPHVVFRVR